MEATIIPMQRRIESLHTKFVAIREEKDDEPMQQPVSGAASEAQEAKNVRTLLSGILMACGPFTRMFVKDSFATSVVQPWVRAFQLSQPSRKYKLARFRKLQRHKC